MAPSFGLYKRLWAADFAQSLSSPFNSEHLAKTVEKKGPSQTIDESKPDALETGDESLTKSSGKPILAKLYSDGHRGARLCMPTQMKKNDGTNCRVRILAGTAIFFLFTSTGFAAKVSTGLALKNYMVDCSGAVESGAVQIVFRLSIQSAYQQGSWNGAFWGQTVDSEFSPGASDVWSVSEFRMSLPDSWMAKKFLGNRNRKITTPNVASDLTDCVASSVCMLFSARGDSESGVSKLILDLPIPFIEKFNSALSIWLEPDPSPYFTVQRYAQLGCSAKRY